MQLGAPQIAFLQTLGKSPDGLQLLGLIQAEIAESNSALRKLAGENLYREQGKAQWLDEFAKRLTRSASAQVIQAHPMRFQTPA